MSPEDAPSAVPAPASEPAAPVHAPADTPAGALHEPVVRIRCPSPEDEARCRAVLEKAGLAPEPQLTWLVVRDADPDRVNEILVQGGALGRVVVREQIGKLVGFVIDHGPRLEGREGSLRATVSRVLTTAGLSSRWVPRPEEEMAAAGAELHEYLMATRGGMVGWARFTSLFCRAAGERGPGAGTGSA